LLFNERIILFGDISQTEQGLVNARIILSEQRQQLEAKAISEEGKRKVGGINTRGKLMLLAIARCFLPGNI
jgi:hypothetical protein